MKKIILITIIVIMASCSKNENDCDAKKQVIEKRYENFIQQVKDNPEPTGINYRQINLLTEEKKTKLKQACD